LALAHKWGLFGCRAPVRNLMSGNVGDFLSDALVGVHLAVTRPLELIDRFECWREYKRSVVSCEPPGPQYEFAGTHAEDPFAAVHESLGVPMCGTCAEEIRAVAAEVDARLPEGNHNDAGATLARTLWILTRHLKPLKIVETGVARGVSSAFLLDALDTNGDGHLWSIDLPPLLRGRRVEIGSAVPDRLRSRWTYIRGASRRELPPLLADLDVVDMFVHDGLHTRETMTFEFHYAWPYLTQKGVLVVDNAESNSVFMDFANRVDHVPLLMTEPDKGTVIGLLKV
jgi:hypothetical protein